MTMRITTATAYRDALEALDRANVELARRQREVSSGRRVNVASDDPSSAAAAINEHAEGAALDSYIRASDTISSRLSVLDTVLADAIDQLTAVRVAALSGRGSAAGQAQREAAAREIGTLRESLLADFNTSFHGVQLFAGTAGATRPFVRQADGSIGTYEGDTGQASVAIDRQSAVVVTMDGDALTRGADPTHIFDSLDDLAAAIRAGDDPGIQAALEKVDRAVDRVQQAQSRVGGDMSRLQQQRTNLQALELGSAKRLSAAEEADLAASISALKQADTARQATLGALASISSKSLLDYL
jgi:flagellar hook-associated protein 3 FlgL